MPTSLKGSLILKNENKPILDFAGTNFENLDHYQLQ